MRDETARIPYSKRLACQKGRTMSTTTDWITSRITQAKAGRHLLTSSVVARMDTLLRDQLARRPLTKAELTAVAKHLIMVMIPPSPETGAK